MKKIYPCVIGLGYVGLPLFVRLKKKFKTVGFDIDTNRVKSLLEKVDKNGEYNKNQLKLDNHSKISDKLNVLKKCNFYIITVPTPINKKKLQI